MRCQTFLIEVNVLVTSNTERSSAPMSLMLNHSIEYLETNSAPQIIKIIVSAALLICLSSFFVGGALGQTPAKTLTPEEQELLKAQKANEEAQAEYYREQTNKLRQPPPTPTPGKTFSQSVAENPASVVGVIGTVIGAIIVALATLTTLYFNSRNAIKAQRDSQFYEAMKRMGDKDSPTLRASAAGLLAFMAPQEWREPKLSKKWPFLEVQMSKPYLDTTVNQCLIGHLLEQDPVVTESVKKALLQLVPLVPHDLSAITCELHAANRSLQDELASSMAEFFVMNNYQLPPNPYEEDEDIEVWKQLKSATGFEPHSLRKLVIHSPSFRNRFGGYRSIIDAQDTGDRGLLLSALHDRLHAVANHLRANVTLFCTALSKLQPKDAPPPNSMYSFSFARAFLVGGEIAQGANLSHLELVNANFGGMLLSDVNLANAFLHGSTLQVRMVGGSLRSSTLRGVDFRGAWIAGVDMTDAGMADAKVSNAIGLSSNWWKADFTRSNYEVDSAVLESLFKKEGQLSLERLKKHTPLSKLLSRTNSRRSSKNRIRSFDSKIRRAEMQDPKHLTLSTGRDYEVEYRTAGGAVQTVEGELISLDESGFVVIESNGKRVVIRKDLVELMREKSD